MVDGGAWISCCHKEVEVELEDAAMNKMVISLQRPSNLRWDIIGSIIAGVSLIVIIFTVVICICLCRRKYVTVNQNYV